MSPSPTIQEILAAARDRLGKHSESPALDAQVWLAHALKQERAWLLAHPEAKMSEKEAERFWAGIEEMEGGRPLPYLLGEWEFFGLPFFVDERVLIPRPETELLVEEGLKYLKEHAGQARVLDVGTGSGCIAIAIAKHASQAQIQAVDISAAALEVAQGNVERHGLGERIALKQADLLSGLTGQFELICANLPYIPRERLATLAVVKAEPRLALDGGAQGLELLERFLTQAVGQLAPQGCLLAEIDHSHADQVEEMARGQFPEAEGQILEDLAGQKRLLTIRL